jgi:arsenate reductase (thioredoxin)
VDSVYGKKKILFISIDNSTRSQMAEAWMNHLYGNKFDARSAGLSPAVNVNPHAVKVMKEKGIDISHKKPRSAFDVYKSGESFSYIITVCDQSSAERCPVFLGLIKQIHWDFPNTSSFPGLEEEIIDKLRSIRDSIHDQIISWCDEISEEDE